LYQRGIVDERLATAPARAGRGRPGTAVSLRADAGLAVGVAIDRDHIRVAAVDLSTTVLALRTEEIAPRSDGVQTLEASARLVRAVLAENGKDITRIVGVGVGLPGPVDAERGGVAREAGIRRWAGVNARDELSHRLGGVAVPSRQRLELRCARRVPPRRRVWCRADALPPRRPRDRRRIDHRRRALGGSFGGARRERSRAS
jgi:hypothetical protein